MKSQSRSARWPTRLFVALLATTVVAVLGTIIYTYLAYRNAASQVVMERDRQVTYLSAARLQGELSKFTDTLAALARSQGLLAQDSRSRRLALTQAGYRLADFDGGVLVLDHFGSVIATAPPQPAILGDDWSSREVFRQLLASPRAVFSNVLAEGDDGGQVVALGVPVLGDGGQFAGAVIGMFKLGEHTVSSFYASIVRLRMGTTGNMYVVDGAGTILYEPSLTLVGLNFADEVMPGLDLGGDSAAVRRPDLLGRDVVASSAPIPGTPWTLINLADWRSLTSSTRMYADMLLGAMGVGTLVPALGVLVLRRQRHQERLTYDQVRRDSRAIEGLRRALFPPELPVLYGWDLQAHWAATRPERHLLEDHVLLPDGRLMISLLHSAAGGLPGAACMITGRAALRVAAQAGLDPAEALRSANRLLCLDGDPDRHLHGLYGYLDPEQGRFSFALAGMEPPLVYPSSDAPLPSTRHADLGVHLDHEPAQGSVSVPAGGILLISHGLLGDPNSQHEGLGSERLIQCLQGASTKGHPLLDCILLELEDARAGAGEDVLALVLRREPIPPGLEVERP